MRKKTVKTYIFTDKNISFRLVSTKDGECQAVFTLNRPPFIQFYGDMPDETGRFFITRVHFLCSNAGGWLEGDVDASGTGIIGETAFPFGGRAADFSLEGPVNMAGITWGGIRRYDSRFHSSRALTELRNREERIQLVRDWMKERCPPALLVTRKDFESYWQPILLPEPSGEGGTRAMRLALADAGMESEDIQYYNAHGTSTRMSLSAASGGVLNPKSE